MSKRKEAEDDLKPEYDFASMKGGVRGKYVSRLRKGTNVVVLEPEIAAAFPSEAAVKESLRGVLNTTRAVRRSGGLLRRGLLVPSWNDRMVELNAHRAPFTLRAGAAARYRNPVQSVRPSPLAWGSMDFPQKRSLRRRRAKTSEKMIPTLTDGLSRRGDIL